MDFKKGFMIGLVLFITFILSNMLTGFILPFLPLGALGPIGGFVGFGIQIFIMGIVGTYTLKYAK